VSLEKNEEGGRYAYALWCFVTAPALGGATLFLTGNLLKTLGAAIFGLPVAIILTIILIK